MAEKCDQVFKSQEQESDVNFIKIYPSRFFLAPGQAHDADNHSPGSLIHWMSFNDGFWISNDDCILMLHTDMDPMEQLRVFY
mgnify:CR=1 FL=1